MSTSFSAAWASTFRVDRAQWLELRYRNESELPVFFGFLLLALAAVISSSGLTVLDIAWTQCDGLLAGGVV